ncbi:hypothetical protein BDY17DRAFT_297280 [Neohortaea acidophila]|uniref:Uncharacterized protein n=1 Tax=Neohortaea acidophila TaxID=245834 RepID=A0A6A6PU95_9PEZI|nr:uncharacterized protein BDY17DRAFT_297280 [Neohortaea acidophila]KAF2483336.1 hypothetical protein BDY17DRAFT_297280 [Neohortaea acidophila]
MHCLPRDWAAFADLHALFSCAVLAEVKLYLQGCLDCIARTRDLYRHPFTSHPPTINPPHLLQRRTAHTSHLSSSHIINAHRAHSQSKAQTSTQRNRTTSKAKEKDALLLSPHNPPRTPTPPRLPNRLRASTRRAPLPPRQLADHAIRAAARHHGARNATRAAP